MFGSLIKTILLVVNAIAILNDKRFIKKCTKGLVVDFGGEAFNRATVPGEAPTNSGQLIMLILTLRTYGICNHLHKADLLIPLNIITILLELFS